MDPLLREALIAKLSTAVLTVPVRQGLRTRVFEQSLGREVAADLVDLIEPIIPPGLQDAS